MLQRLRTHRVLAALVGAYYIGFLGVGFATELRQAVVYAVVMAILLGAVVAWDARRHLSNFVLGGLALWGGLHMAGGLVPLPEGRVLYNLWLLPFLRFDQLVHAIGFGFSGLAFWESVRPNSQGHRLPAGAITFMGGVGFGALNEMFEFLITRVVPDTNVGGFENSGWDLVANAIGAALAALWTRRQMAASSAGGPSESPAL